MTDKTMIPTEQLKNLVLSILEEMQGIDIRILPVAHLTTIADYMVIVTGRSDRHIRSMAEELAQQVKSQGGQIHGIEGMSTAEWVLIDAGDVLAHIMRPDARVFYDLDRLWNFDVLEQA